MMGTVSETMVAVVDASLKSDGNVRIRHQIVQLFAVTG